LLLLVIPAEAGIQFLALIVVPAKAGIHLAFAWAVEKQKCFVRYAADGIFSTRHPWLDRKTAHILCTALRVSY